MPNPKTIEYDPPEHGFVVDNSPAPAPPADSERLAEREPVNASGLAAGALARAHAELREARRDVQRAADRINKAHDDYQAAYRRAFDYFTKDGSEPIFK